MKGKALFLLVEELNKAERHQLLNTCKRSGDKRHSALYNLMMKHSGSKEGFETLLFSVAKPLFSGEKDEKEKDKTLRRFIDFSIKEIEQVKLKNFLQEDQLLRHFLLSRIYESKGDSSIEKRYLERTGELSEQLNDRFMKAYYVDRMVDHTSRTHTKKEMKILRELLSEKNNLIQKSYHAELARVYDLLSVIQFEDNDLAQGLSGLVLKDDEVEVLLSLAAGSPEEIDYLIARARFSFFEPKRFQSDVSQAMQSIKKIRDGREKERLNRKIAFLRCQHAFHFGESPAKLQEYARPLEGSANGLELFYFHLFRILDLHSRKKALPEPRELAKLPMEPENYFRIEFLQAFVFFLRGEASACIKLFNQLSYVANFQVSTWSRLMELRIHLNKGNLNLCDSLSGRLLRHFQGNKGKDFTLSSSKELFGRMQDELKVRTPKKAAKTQVSLTALHQVIADFRS
jgi:hypothetical protein